MNIKVLAEEISLNDPDTVSDSRLVRVYNDTGSDVVITRRDDANTVIGSATMPGNSVDVFEKGSTDTLEASAVVLATPIAYTN
jgi:hypothetical protein